MKNLRKQLTKKKITFTNIYEEDPKKILFESDLLKYHAGSAAPLVERWCNVTIEGFQYFRNHWTSIGQNARFIQKILFSEVEVARRVNVKLPKEAYKGLKNNMGKNQTYHFFEVFLKADFNNIPFDSTFEQGSPEPK